MAKATEDQEYGIQVTVTYQHASTALGSQNPQAEIWRTVSSTSSATVPSTAGWKPLVTLPEGSQRTYTDVLPNDGNRRFYRVRHTQVGFSPSTWHNDWESAIPRKGPFIA